MSIMGIEVGGVKPAVFPELYSWSVVAGGVWLLDSRAIGEKIFFLAEELGIASPFEDYFVRLCMELGEQYGFELNRTNRWVLSEPNAATLRVLGVLERIIRDGIVVRLYEYKKLFQMTLELCLRLEESWYPTLPPSRAESWKVDWQKLYHGEFTKVLEMVRQSYS